MTDVVTARFQKLRNKGKIVMNPMTQRSCKLTHLSTDYSWDAKSLLNGSLTSHSVGGVSSGFLSADNWLNRHMLTGSFNTPMFDSNFNAWFAPGRDVEDMKQVCLARCLANASNSDALMLVTLAELHKTISSLEQAGAALSRFRQFVRKNKYDLNWRMSPAGYWRTAGDVAKLWLEYRYGLMQSVYDVRSFASAIGHYGTRKRLRFVSSMDQSGPGDILTSGRDVDGWCDETIRITRSRTDSVSAGCLVEVGDKTSGLIDVFGLDRVLTSVWELAPYSFICDWFANTADLIAALEGRLGQKVIGTWTTHTATGTGLYSLYRTGKVTNRGGGSILDGSGCSASLSSSEDVVIKQRVADPLLSWLPRWNLRFNWKKAADLAALFRGLRA